MRISHHFSRFCLVFFVAFFLAPSVGQAATACCLCTPPAGVPKACLTIPSERLQKSGQVVSCTDLPSVVGDTLNGWKCLAAPIAEGACQPKPVGTCPAAPLDAYTAGNSEPVTPSGGQTTALEDEEGIVPQLNVPIPGLEFTAPRGAENPLLAQYISAIYQFMISISAVVATVMFTYGAFVYLIGSALPSIKQGKTIMQEAVIGMILVFSAAAILRIVSPNTVTLHSLIVEPLPRYSDYESDVPALTASVSGYQRPQAICRGDGCAALCDGCSVKLPLPSAPWIPSASQLTQIPTSAGIQLATRSGQYLRTEAASALAAAGIAAQQAPGGPYTLQIGEAYRPLEGQLYGTCRLLCGKTQKHFAAPGASMHGTGLAVDISLWKGRTALVTPQDPLSNQARNIRPENARLLQQIMASAGWVQYCREIWHWEFGVPAGGEKSTHCAWPPPPPR